MPAFESVQRAGQIARFWRIAVLRKLLMAGDILGNVDQVLEIAECSRHGERLVGVQPLQQAVELVRRSLKAVTMKLYRRLTDSLDGVIDFLSLLVPDDLTKNAAEVAYVLLLSGAFEAALML